MSKMSITCECLANLNLNGRYGTRYEVKFGHHLRFFFLNIQNQIAAGNVIQLNKKKA